MGFGFHVFGVLLRSGLSPHSYPCGGGQKGPRTGVILDMISGVNLVLLTGGFQWVRLTR